MEPITDTLADKQPVAQWKPGAQCPVPLRLQAMPISALEIHEDDDFTGIAFGLCDDPSRRDDIAAIVAFILETAADEAGVIADRIVNEERFRIEMDYHTAVHLATELFKVGVTANAYEAIPPGTLKIECIDPFDDQGV